ncbi:MAG: VTT domain-containing protein [Clostridiales bacterium]|nr:VTT domain-containing protein [Clostridiales bacterium]
MSASSAQKKNQARKRLLNFLGGLLLTLAVVLVVIWICSRDPEIMGWYAKYQTSLTNMETRIMSIDNVVMLISAILLFYLIKSVVPIIPISALCFLVGAVMPLYAAVSINILGLTIMLTVKFFWGRKLGGGSVHSVLQKNESILRFFEHDGNANPWILFVTRLVPIFPVNSVSQLYGAIGFDYPSFLIVSLGGFMPNLVSYTIVGRHMYDPLSSKFLIPLIIIIAITGVSILAVNVILTRLGEGKK